MAKNYKNPVFDLYRREINARIQQNKRLYSLSIEEAIASGNVLGPVKFDAETESFKVSGFQFKFRKGDTAKICLRSGRALVPISDEPLEIKDIRFSGIGFASIIPAKMGLASMIDIDPKFEYFLVKDYNPIFDRMLFKKIREIEKFSQKQNISVNFKSSFLDGLNFAQQNAIEYILRNQFSGTIQGPPGAGKTEVLSRIVEMAVSNNLKVGILSYTNRAVDNALERVSRVVKEGVFRVGKSDSFLDHKTILSTSLFSKLKDYKVFGATSHKFVFSSKFPQIDILILDEAGQIPSYFLPGIKAICSNIIMIGDHHQLPPIMTARTYKDQRSDCFSLYMEEQDERPMLEIQYRMNDVIQQWSSERYYEGRLKSHFSNANRDIFSDIDSPIFGKGVIHHQKESGGAEKIAREVVKYAFHAKNISGLNWDDIGIISPYRKHAGLINKCIQEQLGYETNDHLFADTVDRFQGMEKEFIIYSLCGEFSAGKDSFLNDYRRINVSITRAKSRFYLFTDDQNYGHGELGTFLNWCSQKSAKKEAA